MFSSLTRSVDRMTGFKVTALDGIKLVQSVCSHKDVVTCLAITADNSLVRVRGR